MVGGTVGEIVASQQSEVRGRRHRARLRRLAGLRAFERRRPAQARSGGGAGHDGARRARHAGHDGLCRPPRDRPAEGGRDRRGRGGVRRGRLGGRADRQDQGMPRGRDRRRRRQVPLCRRRRSASMPASITARPTFASALDRCLPQGHRRLFRECRRRRAAGGVAAAQRFRPRPRVRADRAVQRRRRRCRGRTCSRCCASASRCAASSSSDFAAKQADFLRDAGEWVRSGRLKYREDIVDGLEKAPSAFLGLLQGKNFGKLLVRVAK